MKNNKEKSYYLPCKSVMKMKRKANMKIKSIWVAGVLMPVFATNLWAQDNGKTQSGYNENVVVTAPYQPTLGLVEKPDFIPNTIDTSLRVPASELQIISRPFATSYPTENIKPAKVLGEPIPKLFNNTVKVGFGNHYSPLLEANFSIGRNRNHEVAASLVHRSAYGKMKNYDLFKTNNSLNEVGVTGRIFNETFITSLSIGYSQKEVSCYGVGDSSLREEFVNAISDENFHKEETGYKVNPRRWYQNSHAVLTFTDNATEADALRFDALVDYNLNLTNWRSIENSVVIGGGVSKMIMEKQRSVDMLSVGARVRFEDNMYRDGINDGYWYGIDNEKYHQGNELRNAYHLNFQPTMKFKYEFVEMDAALVFHVYQNQADEAEKVDGKTRFQFNPVVDLKLHIVPKVFTFFVGTGGGITRNTIENISRINPYLHGPYYSDLKFTRDKFNAYAGLDGILSRHVDYRICVSAHFMQDVLSFDYYRYQVKDPGSSVGTTELINYGYNDFKPIYSGDVFNLNVRGDLNARVAEKFTLHIDAEYDYYSKLIYYKPQVLAHVDFRYNIVNRVWVYTGFSEQSGMKAKDRLGKDVDLGGGLAWNMGAEYRFLKRMSAFLDMNLMLSEPDSDYFYQWYDMPTYKFTVHAGVSIDF